MKDIQGTAINSMYSVNTKEKIVREYFLLVPWSKLFSHFEKFNKDEFQLIFMNINNGKCVHIHIAYLLFEREFNLETLMAKVCLLNLVIHFVSKVKIFIKIYMVLIFILVNFK